MGGALYKETKNKVFKDVTPEGFAEVFEKVLSDEKGKLTYGKTIANFYAQNEYDPIFVMDHIANGDLKDIVAHYKSAGEHGLDPDMFKAKTMDALVAKFYDKKGIKTLDEAYRSIAQLELLTANTLITYTNALQYGIINPRRIYARYYTETKRPDSASIDRVFHISSIKGYLDSIQPNNPQYLALQKALVEGIKAGNLDQEKQRSLIVNLERLRWRNKPSADKYVIVNIPDYTLDVMESGKSTLNMKVCVGEGRNMENEVSLATYDESDKVDRPFSRETPQLNSMIHSVDVNPIWNIPESIANKEIIVEARKDPYYLANKNINVYKNGEKIEDTETIDWGSASADTYSFKQQPGSDNSLGKIKFLFNNKSSVYLHDTPAQLPFKQTVRAVSHGCVRLEKPKELALALFGSGKKYDMIDKFMGEDKPAPTSISLSPKVPVYITYITCWQDANGQLQFRPDVYGLDVVLFGHLQKLFI